MEPRRRLSDKIIEAHGQACAEGKLEVAEILIQALEVDLTAIGGGVGDKRQNTEMLEAAYECHKVAKDAAKT
ncbi:MAG: hypothetical protein ACE1ZY_08015 [Alphaproteobacteria bacterium]